MVFPEFCIPVLLLSILGPNVAGFDLIYYIVEGNSEF